MSVRFRIYLVDAAPLAGLLDRDINDALRWISDSADLDSEALIPLADENSGIELRWHGRSAYLVGAGVERHSLRTYLEASWAGALDGLLQGLATRPDVEWVTSYLQGHRRWWLGGFLQGMQECPAFDRHDVAKAASLASKLLRGGDCGFPVPPDPGLRSLSLPVRPAHDEDAACGGWSASETADFWALAERFVTHTHGRAPPGPLGIAPKTAGQWKALVDETVGSLLSGRDLGYPSPHLVSFLS